ncbi:MAG: DUF1365 domain-containing protein [Acidimicrobiia bacterium]|nr:DUF1365 domain-containing protein [Acidimicrobiia bacterium]
MTGSSAVYVGRVSHRRVQPMGHRLRYRTYSLLLDLDDLDRATARPSLLGYNRWNIFSIYDRDFGPRDGSPLRAWIDSQLQQAGIELEGGSVQLLAFPRILGYSFNPLTIWFCRDSSGELRALVYEIHNTFGHSLSHVIPVDSSTNQPLRHSFAKELHVSPFFDRTGEYSFTLRPPGRRFSVSIDYTVEGTKMMTATMNLERRPLTNANLVRLFLTHPLLTAKVIWGIHWNALLLLLKGAKYRPVPNPPDTAIRFEGTFEGTS